MTTATDAQGAGRWTELPVILILAASVGIVMLDRMVQIFLGPHLVADLGLKPSQIGVLSGVLAVCFAVSSLLGGMLSDRIGLKRVLIPCMVAFGLLSWLSGLARNFEEMLVVRALLGVAEGPCWATIMALAQSKSPPQRRGRNTGVILGVNALLGGALGPVVCTALAEMVGWRATFFIAGVPALILALLVAVKVPEPERHDPVGHSAEGLPHLLAMPQLWLCFTAAVLFSVSVMASFTFAPLYLTQVAGLSGDAMGLVLGVSGLGAFVYSLFTPALSDKIGRKLTIILAAIPGVLLPFLLMSHLPTPVLILGAFLLTSSSAIPPILFVVIPTELVPRHLAATALGFIVVGSEAVGGVLGPVLGGVLSDRLGLHVPLLMSAAAVGGIILLALALPETKGRPVAP